MLPMSLESRSPLEGFITRAGVGRHWKRMAMVFVEISRLLIPTTGGSSQLL